MLQPSPVTRDLVLVGGGHAHIEVLRYFGMHPMPGVRVTMISREVHTPYSGMLPGLIAGHYGFDEVHIDLGPLARFAAARLYHDEVVGLDLAAQCVVCRTRPPIPFDVLSIDIGSSPALSARGAAVHAVPVKPVSSFTARWSALRARVRATSGPLRIGVVGGGAGGVEILLAARHRLRADLVDAGDDPSRLSFHLVTAGDDVLTTHGRLARALYRRHLAAAGVVVHFHSPVTDVDAHGVRMADGQQLALDECLWVTHAAAPGWPRETGLATDAQGFIRVAATLQSVSHPIVFAAGDIAAVDAHPRPKSGVFAVRQGRPLAENLQRALRGESLVPYTPQRRFLGLISTGGRHAIASRGTFACGGDWVWRWKDWIDRRFVRRYAELPAMAAPTGNATAADEEAMRCGGCGSKIGADLLRDALAELVPQYGSDVLIGLDAPDDAAVVRLPLDTVAVHTVDAFRGFIDDPWRMGRIAANHCLGDIYAMGATPQTALALVTLPLAAPSKMRADLVQVMAGALSVLRETNTALVGGHTAEGAEFALGFAINGYATEAALRRKLGASPGDALILTRPLGSGVLLAGAMRGLARTRWVEAALDTMGEPLAAAARCLVAHGATAVTDVTGFGLAGHLLEMLRDGTLEVVLDLAALPVYEGAVALSAQGVRSSLYADNARTLARIEAGPAAHAHANFPLLFDPQTAGGLLAAVPRARADECVAALHRASVSDAVIIGEFRAARGGAALTLST